MTAADATASVAAACYLSRRELEQQKNARVAWSADEVVALKAAHH